MISQIFQAISTRVSLAQSGLSTSKNVDIVVAVSHRLHLDFGDSYADNGSSIEVDLLGCGAELLIATRDNCFHDHSCVLSWADECRKLIELFCLNKCGIFSHFSSLLVHMSQRRSLLNEFYDGSPRPNRSRSRQSSTLCASAVHFPLSRFRFHLRFDIFEVRNSCETFSRALTVNIPLFFQLGCRSSSKWC